MSTYLETYSFWSASLKNIIKSLNCSKEALVSPTPCLKFTNSPWCSCVLCSHAHQGLSNSTNSAALKFLQSLIFSDENTQKFTKSIAGQNYKHYKIMVGAPLLIKGLGMGIQCKVQYTKETEHPPHSVKPLRWIGQHDQIKTWWDANPAVSLQSL
jgi:hypothetical protein